MVYIAHISPFTCGFISLDTDKWRVGVIVMWTRGWSPAVTGQERLCERISVTLNSAVNSPVCILVLLIQSVWTNTGGAWGKNNVFLSPHTGGPSEGEHVDFTFLDPFHLFSSGQFCCVLIRSLQHINSTLLVWQQSKVKDEVLEMLAASGGPAAAWCGWSCHGASPSWEP